MCEPHAAHQWRDSPPKAPQHDLEQDINATASPSPATTIMHPENVTLIRQPLSPPSSPPASTSIPAPALGFQPFPPHSIDVLASQLGSSSLDHFSYNSPLPTTCLPETALSPISLPDDGYGNTQSVLSRQGSGSMEIDPDNDSNTVISRNTPATEKQEDLECPINRPFNPFMPIAVDPIALAEAPDVSRSLCRPNTNGGFEVDEGYCEDDDDFSWLQPLVPRRTAGTPNGIKKRYELGYRRSADAARRCRNTIHSVPRMRRRDKKRSRQSQPHSTASSVRDRSDSQASQMVVSTQ
ncbi:hypothetical protein F53441_3156 [Fusarium austroafricanum]|uniref:Uncharacterized protein n=1 Tax=Fusarium austroafricanum TaxID=2364996 RepID=A0A8H4KQE3_9HYPO|nr:hypothetical protein F53441_3156 [Fusarium austroafricanum]